MQTVQVLDHCLEFPTWKSNQFHFLMMPVMCFVKSLVQTTCVFAKCYFPMGNPPELCLALCTCCHWLYLTSGIFFFFFLAYRKYCSVYFSFLRQKWKLSFYLAIKRKSSEIFVYSLWKEEPLFCTSSLPVWWPQHPSHWRSGGVHAGVPRCRFSFVLLFL